MTTDDASILYLFSDYLIECSTMHGLFCFRVFLFVCGFCFLHIAPCCRSGKYTIICSSIIIVNIINSNYMQIFVNITGVDLLSNAVHNSHLGLRANRISTHINIQVRETLIDFANIFGSRG